MEIPDDFLRTFCCQTRMKTTVEMLRDVADRGEAARSFRGMERLVVKLLRDAARELEAQEKK